MDQVDEPAEKVVDAFEPLSEVIILEQIAVPEDLADPEGRVDLRVVAAETYSFEEELIVRARVSVPTAVALECDTDELERPFREELLHSEQFRQAAMVAGVVSRAAEGLCVPSPAEAEQN